MLEMRDLTLSTNIDALSVVDPSHHIMYGLRSTGNNGENMIVFAIHTGVYGENMVIMVLLHCSRCYCIVLISHYCQYCIVHTS